MRLLTAVMLIAGLAAAVCLTFAAQSPSPVAADGMLIEPFAWMVLGRLMLIVTAAAAVTVGGIWMLRRN